MRYLNTKDHKRRLLFLNFFLLRNLFKYYKFSLNLLYYFRFFYKLHQFPRNSSISRLNNRCHISSYSTSIYKFKYSRFVLKRLLNNGLILGFKKSSW
jgi:ribosomal protein S14